MKVLITGGAGFIGTHLSRSLLRQGHEVTVLDNFSPQIHGETADVAADVRDHLRLVRGDVQDEGAWRAALAAQDAVVHLAAETGTGQSMYQVNHYADVNLSGTAKFLQLMVSGEFSVRSVVVASSRAVYGEGAYRCMEHGVVFPKGRLVEDLKAGFFEPRCPQCAAACAVVPTPEAAPLQPASFYGLTKQVQEQMVLMYAEALGINGFAMRYQNVYGPGQSLKNPYTGILAIFSNQARANQPIYVFEDGLESRDFAYIDDVVEATVRCVTAEKKSPAAFNVGTGVPVTVKDVVSAIIQFFGSSSPVAVNGAFRIGDIRHSLADLTRIQSELNFVPKVAFEDGVREFLQWSASQEPSESRYEQSLAEMRAKGLMYA